MFLRDSRSTVESLQLTEARLQNLSSDEMTRGNAGGVRRAKNEAIN